MPHLPVPFLGSAACGLAPSVGSPVSGLTSLPRVVTKPVWRELDWLFGRSDIA